MKICSPPLRSPRRPRRPRRPPRPTAASPPEGCSGQSGSCSVVSKKRERNVKFLIIFMCVKTFHVFSCSHILSCVNQRCQMETFGNKSLTLCFSLFKKMLNSGYLCTVGSFWTNAWLLFALIIWQHLSCFCSLHEGGGKKKNNVKNSLPLMI